MPLIRTSKSHKESFENEPSVVLNMKIVKETAAAMSPVLIFIWPMQFLYHHRRVLEITGVLWTAQCLVCKKNSIWVIPTEWFPPPSLSICYSNGPYWVIWSSTPIILSWVPMDGTIGQKGGAGHCSPHNFNNQRIQNGFAALWGEFTFIFGSIKSLTNGRIGRLMWTPWPLPFFLLGWAWWPPKNRTLALLDCRGYHIHTPLFL